MKVKMTLLSDTIFGNGMSVPGAEDLSVLCDAYGFPYYKGSTFKGVLREQAERMLNWQQENDSSVLTDLFGKSGSDIVDSQLYFSDFVLSDYVKKQVLDTIDKEHKETILDAMTNLRTFTSLNEDGVAKKGSLRIARCVNQGLTFYGDVHCDEKYQELIRETIESIKWIGTKRNRGFGKVKLRVIEGMD